MTTLSCKVSEGMFASIRAGNCMHGSLSGWLMYEVFVHLNHLIRPAVSQDLAVIKQNHAIAYCPNNLSAVRNKHSGFSLTLEVMDTGFAFLLEFGVPNRENLVDHKDLRIDLNGN